MKLSRLLAAVSFALVASSSIVCYGNNQQIEWPSSVPAATRATLSNILRAESRNSTTYASLIIQVDDDATVTELTNMGVVIFFQRDNLLLACVPTTLLCEVTDLDGVRNVQSTFSTSTEMDVARPFCFVDQVQAGTNLLQAYTGKNVVAGISDIGFDSNHIAFDGALKGIYHFNTSMAQMTSATTEDEIEAYTTDDAYEYHATHVANILGGRYTGNQYYGVATGSDMVITTSELTDVGILAGVESIIQYARQVGEPAVINLSLGSYNGPHDGTDLTCQYLSKCAQDAIICLSSGNYGQKNISAAYQFTETDSIARVGIMDRAAASGLSLYGITDVWSNNTKPLSARIEVYNNDYKTLLYTSEWCVGEGDAQQWTFSSANDSELAKYINGYVEIYSGLESLNDRYNVTFSYDYTTGTYSSHGSWSLYRIGLVLTGEDGTEVQFYSDGSYSVLAKTAYDPTVVPDPSQSISNLCCADGIIAVGMCTSRNSTPVLNSSNKTWSVTVDQVTPYTSYGTSYQGEALPHFCAPGCYIVSALSSYYYNEYPSTSIAAVSEVDGVKYYWMAEGGTSMAAPLTCGIIAMWLEADPTLTRDDVLEIASTTCNTDFTDIDDPRWGCGCIDAIAGLQKIVQNSSIGSPTAKPIVTINDNGSISVTAPNGASVKLYDAYGRSLDPSAPHRPGVYILSVEGLEPIKVVVK